MVKVAWVEENPAEASQLEEHICFVCFESSGILVQPCPCNDRFIHVECQMKLMRRAASHHHGCPICQSPYCNMYSSATQVFRLTEHGWVLVAWCLGTSLLCIAGVYLLQLWRAERNRILLYFGASFITCSIILNGVACSGHLFSYRTMTFITSWTVVKVFLQGGAGYTWSNPQKLEQSRRLRDGRMI